MKILIADDEPMKRLSLVRDVTSWGHEVVSCADGQDAAEALRSSLFDVVVADLKMPGLGGMDLLREIKAGANAGCDVIIITAYGSIPVAVEAMRYGAFDFVTKPFDNEKLQPVLQRIEGRRAPARPDPGATTGREDEEAEGALVGRSPAHRRALELVEICARTDTNVLICGQTGTGKDLVASCIHKKSVRRSHPLVKVSCAIFPKELIASELYGHERGAFTGAERNRFGRFDLAAGGTLYLDDVDDIPYEQQVKLLRVIEERTFERVGGNTSIRADVRIIASSKKDLLAEIAAGSFREDLYYRLNVMRIDLPPLKERMDDLPPLISHFVHQLSGQEKVVVDPEMIGVLASHTWPGNVRELRNTLARAYLTGRGTLTAEHLAREIGQHGAEAEGGAGFHERLDRFERDLLVRALQAAGGNKTAAARQLGMKPSTLRDKLERHGL